MSLERELVFELRDKGNTPEDVLEIVEHMGDPEFSKCNPIKLDTKLVNVALKQYEVKEKFKNKKKYQKELKKELRELLNIKIKEVEDNMPNLLSVKIYKEGRICGLLAGNRICDCQRVVEKYFLKVKYLNGKNLSLTKYYKYIDYCRNCGRIDINSSVYEELCIDNQQI